MSFLWGRYVDGKVELFPSETAKTSADGKTAILFSRLDVDFRRLELPLVSDIEARNIVSHRIRGLYPGKPDEAGYDVIIERHRKILLALVFLAPKTILAAYRTVLSGKARLLSTYSLIQTFAKSQPGTTLHLIITPHWIELFWFRERALLREECLPLKGAFTMQHAARLEALISSVLPDHIYLWTDDRFEEESVETVSAVCRSHAVCTFRHFESKNVGSLDLFRESDLRSAKRQTALRVFLAAIFSVLLLLLFFKPILAKYSALHETRQNIERAAVGRDLSQLQKKQEALAKLRHLHAQKPMQLSSIFAGLETVLSGYRIRSFTKNGADIVLELSGKNPYILIERFSALGFIKNIAISQVNTSPGSEVEQFSLQGVLHAE